jgi:hypothetical protein
VDFYLQSQVLQELQAVEPVLSRCAELGDYETSQNHARLVPALPLLNAVASPQDDEFQKIAAVTSAYLVAFGISYANLAIIASMICPAITPTPAATAGWPARQFVIASRRSRYYFKTPANKSMSVSAREH